MKEHIKCQARKKEIDTYPRISPRHFTVRGIKKDPTGDLQAFRMRKKKSGTYPNQKSEWVWEYSRTTLEARRPWSNAFRILKENDFQPRTQYLAKLSIK